MNTKPMLRTTLITAAVAFATSGAFAGGAPKEAGVWYDDTGKGAVKIEICNGNKLCGKIYWLKTLVNDEGKPLIDRHNPNESQRTRPICGLQIMGNLAAMDDGTWDSGWIYDPKEGKSYSVALQLDGPETLKVTGYLALKLMGRTLTWKRAPNDLPSCTQNAAAPAPAPAAAAGAAQKKAGAGEKTKAGAKEDLPWADDAAANKKAPAAAAKPAAEASKLGAAKPASVKPTEPGAAKNKAAPKPGAASNTTQPLPEPTAAR